MEGKKYNEKAVLDETVQDVFALSSERETIRKIVIGDKDHRKLENFLDVRFIPGNVFFMKRKNKKTGEVTVFPFIRLNDIMDLKLDKPDMEYVIKYLRHKNIKISCYEEILHGNFEDYDYFSDIDSDYRPKYLSEKELLEKFNLYRKNNDSSIREEIILGSSRIVSYLAWQIAGIYDAEVDELVQYGMETLIKCVDIFDPSFNKSFVAYAYIAIYRKMLASVSELKGLKKGHFAEIYLKVEKEVERDYGQKVYENYGLIPIIVDRLVEGHYISERNKNAIRRRIMMLYADGKDYDNKVDNIASQRSTQEIVNFNDALLRLKSIIDSLNEKERKLLIYKYMNEDDIVKSVDECAAHFNISTDEVLYIERKLCAKLRHPSFSKKISDYADVTMASSDRIIDNTYDNISDGDYALAKRNNNKVS